MGQDAHGVKITHLCRNGCGKVAQYTVIPAGF